MDDQREEKVVTCKCPYCDVVIEEEKGICSACLMVIVECVHCGEPVREGADTCPHCGEPPK
jgi:RNA polymerase subunit RPABC4/transcription elongation factor Spt4